MLLKLHFSQCLQAWYSTDMRNLCCVVQGTNRPMRVNVLVDEHNLGPVSGTAREPQRQCWIGPIEEVMVFYA